MKAKSIKRYTVEIIIGTAVLWLLAGVEVWLFLWSLQKQPWYGSAIIAVLTAYMLFIAARATVREIRWQRHDGWAEL